MQKAKHFFWVIAVLFLFLCLSSVPKEVEAAAGDEIPSLMWINHLDFLAGDSSVITSFNAVNSGVGGGLSGLIVQSTTTGDVADGGGNKVIEKGLVVPPGYDVDGVRVCYELSNPGSHITQIRLAQVQDPPDKAFVVLDDGTDLTDSGPICVDSALPSAPIDLGEGALRLSFRVNFDTPISDSEEGDKIVVRAVGLHLISYDDGLQEQIDELRTDLENHSHVYLTGKGVGHNNTLAVSGPPEFSEEPVDEPVPEGGGPIKKKKKKMKKIKKMKK